MILKRLWDDDAGAVFTTELVLVSSIATMGMLVGLVDMRDSVVAEMRDMGAAVASINQSYRFEGLSSTSAATSGSSFEDEADSGEASLTNVAGISQFSVND